MEMPPILEIDPVVISRLMLYRFVGLNRKCRPSELTEQQLRHVVERQPICGHFCLVKCILSLPLGGSSERVQDHAAGPGVKVGFNMITD